MDRTQAALNPIYNNIIMILYYIARFPAMSNRALQLQQINFITPYNTEQEKKITFTFLGLIYLMYKMSTCGI